MPLTSAVSIMFKYVKKKTKCLYSYPSRFVEAEQCLVPASVRYEFLDAYARLPVPPFVDLFVILPCAPSLNKFRVIAAGSVKPLLPTIRVDGGHLSLTHIFSNQSITMHM